MRVLWIVGGRGETIMSHKVATVLKEDGVDVSFFPSTHVAHGVLESLRRVPLWHPDVLDMAGKGEPVSDTRVRELDKRYPQPGIHALVCGDPFLLNADYEQTTRYAARILEFWEQFFARDRYDWILFAPTGTMLERAAGVVGQSLGARLGILCTAPRRTQYTVLDVSDEWIWSDLLRALSDPKDVIERTSPETVLAAVEESLAMAKSNMPRPFWTLLKTARWHLRYLRMRYAGTARTRDYFNAGLESQTARRQQWFRVTGPWRPYAQRPPDGPYVYFPWHAEGDANILARYPLLRDMPSISRQIALALPVGTTLCIKEHPYSVGQVPLREIRDLASTPNIRIIDPLKNGYEVIRNAAAVVTIGGTSGWEAFLLKRPVVTFGGSFYAYSNLVHNVGGLHELPGVIRRAIELGDGIYEEGTSWMDFVRLSIGTACVGNYFGYKSSFGGAWPEDWSPDNVRRIAIDLRRILNREPASFSRDASGRFVLAQSERSK